MEVDAASEEAAPNAVGRSPSNTAPASDAQVRHKIWPVKADVSLIIAITSTYNAAKVAHQR